MVNYERQEIYPSCYCNNCRQLYPAYNQSKIIWAPPTLIINLKDPFTKHKFISDLSDYVRNSDKFLFRKILEVKLNRLNNPSITDDDRMKILYDILHKREIAKVAAVKGMLTLYKD